MFRFMFLNTLKNSIHDGLAVLALAGACHRRGVDRTGCGYDEALRLSPLLMKHLNI